MLWKMIWLVKWMTSRGHWSCSGRSCSPWRIRRRKWMRRSPAWRRKSSRYFRGPWRLYSRGHWRLYSIHLLYALISSVLEASYRCFDIRHIFVQSWEDNLYQLSLMSERQILCQLIILNTLIISRCQYNIV